MATIHIHITQEEKDIMLDTMKKFGTETTAVSKLAKEAGLNPNRARFIVDDLVNEGYVEKIVARRFGNHYIRYIYRVVDHGGYKTEEEGSN